MRRREFVFGTATSFLSALIPHEVAAEARQTLREAAVKRGIEIGAMIQPAQFNDPKYAELFAANFTLAGLIFNEMEWASNPGLYDAPDFYGLKNYVTLCQKYGMRLRARQIYGDETRPVNAHLRKDGTPKNKNELEQTLIRRAQQCCAPLKGTNSIIQVIDEILADHEGGLRRNPFSDALGETYVDILFHAAHDAAPDALLMYQEFGPEVDPDQFFARKTRDHLALLERLRNRNVPITGAGYGGFVQPTPIAPVLKRSYFKAVEDLGYDIHLNELSIIYTICGNNITFHPKSDKENNYWLDRIYEGWVEFLCGFKRLREITFWAPIDHYNTIETGTRCVIPYSGARPGLFNSDLSRKPIYDRLVKIVSNSKGGT
jgi:GH35 family endo-1,4-beta-xylanase